jgi:succinate dehydrogenase (ubiquinone) membrane anchor subunit
MFSRIRSFKLNGVAKFHSGKKATSAETVGGVVEADSSKQLNKFYHISGLVLAGLTPVAFVLSPSVINMPVDILLGLVFPFHSHVAVNYVISDYVPKANRSMARMALLATSVITVVGLLKLNIQGPGLTETIKSLWKKPEAKK